MKAYPTGQSGPRVPIAWTGFIARDQIPILPAVTILLILLGWYQVIYQSQTLVDATTLTYQQTQLEITRAVARSIQSYVTDQIKAHNRKEVAELEQEIFTRFIAPIRLLNQGDAWIYTPEYVVFDQSSDFPDEYRGKSMAEIFALQAQNGASHYQEMTEAVINAQEGTGWYIWLPDKGREIAAWTPVRVGELVWVIGLSTPLPEILEVSGVQAKIRNSYLLMGIASLTVVITLGVWYQGRRQRDQAENKREQLLAVEQEQRLLAETLAQAFLALASHTDRSKVLDEILNQVQQLVSYSTANIVLIEDGVMRFVRWRGYQRVEHESLLAFSQEPLTGFPLDAEVAESGQAVVIGDVTQDPRWKPTVTSSSVQSYLAAPILLQERVIGLLRLNGNALHQFSTRDIARLQPLTHAAAIALENTRLYDQLQKELVERTENQHRALDLSLRLFSVQYTGAAIASSLDLHYILETITVEIVYLLRSESCRVYEWHPSADSIIELAGYNRKQDKSIEPSKVYHLADYPWLHSLLTQKQSHQLLLSQSEADPAAIAFMQERQLKSLLLLPMEAQGQVIGLLEVSQTQDQQTFTIDDIALTQQLANQTATALRNARLYAEINRRLEEQTALQEVISVISSTLDLDTVLNHIVNQMGRLVDATSTYLCSYNAEMMTSTVLAEYFGPRACAEEKISDFGVSYPLPRDFTRNFEQLTAGQAELVYFDDPKLDQNSHNHMRQFGVQTILNIPLRVKNRVIAFAELWESRQKRVFSNQELELFQSIAQQAAVALDNAQLYNQATQEIAERRKLESELRESETKFRTLAETTAAAIFIFQQNRNRYVNPAAAAITGYSEAELLAMDFWEIIHPDFRDLVFIRGRARLQGQAVPPRYELKVITKNNEARWLEVNLGLINFEGQGAVLGTAFDVTDRKEATAALEKSEANLRAFFENSEQAFILFDKNYQIQAFNKAANEGTKQVVGQALQPGNTVDQYVEAEELAQFKASLDQALQGRAVSQEKMFLLEGREIWVQFNFNPVFADAGQVLGACFSTFDITLRKKMIETLAESEKRLLTEFLTVMAITRALVTEVDLNKLLEFIMIQAKYLTQADGVAVSLLNEDQQQLEVAILGANHHKLEISPADETRLHIKSNIQLPLPGSPVEQALATHSIQVSQGVEAGGWEAALQTGPDPKPIPTIVCAPLTTQNKDLGALLIWFHQAQLFSQHDTHMMALFADQSALALNNARLHTLNRQLAIAQERQRLARDLHDSVTQTLYSIGLGAETALELISRQRSQDIHKPLAHIHQLTRIALKEIREQVHHLHPAAFAHKTLGELLQTYCAMVRQQYGLLVELNIDPELNLSIYQRENLFYLAKEALWNVIKHAQGAQVQLSLTQANQLAILSITDNGPGFVSAASTETQMYGLRSMRERAALLDASFMLDSNPEQGTRITVQFPLSVQSV